MKGKDPKHWSEEQEKERIACGPLVAGLNDNLEFLGRQLHVQTENVGSPVARIVTQVFCGGRVVLSKKSACESFDFGRIQQLMKAQHCQIIREITDKQAKILRSH